MLVTVLLYFMAPLISTWYGCTLQRGLRLIVISIMVIRQTFLVENCQPQMELYNNNYQDSILIMMSYCTVTYTTRNAANYISVGYYNLGMFYLNKPLFTGVYPKCIHVTYYSNDPLGGIV